jgi:hypothetical protein
MTAIPYEASVSPWGAILLAATYERCVTNLNNDGVTEPLNLRFAGWLAGCWRYDGPPEPVWPPQAISSTHNGFQAMRWYTRGDTVYGYVAGVRGCYTVPATGSIGLPPGLRGAWPPPL